MTCSRLRCFSALWEKTAPVVCCQRQLNQQSLRRLFHFKRLPCRRWDGLGGLKLSLFLLQIKHLASVAAHFIHSLRNDLLLKSGREQEFEEPLAKWSKLVWFRLHDLRHNENKMHVGLPMQVLPLHMLSIDRTNALPPVRSNVQTDDALTAYLSQPCKTIRWFCDSHITRLVSTCVSHQAQMKCLHLEIGRLGVPPLYHPVSWHFIRGVQYI